MRAEGTVLPRVCLSQFGDAEAFGPLVACAVLLDSISVRALADLSRTEWPGMPAPALSRTARRVSQVVPFETVQLTPRKYNTLLNKMTTRVKVLNWAYKKALGGLLERYREAGAATFDLHAPAFAVLGADLPRAVPLIFRGLDEVDPGLAAAGVLARAHFEKGLSDLERKLAEVLPRGADPGAALVRIFERGGAPMVLQTAKRDDPRVMQVIAAPRAAG